MATGLAPEEVNPGRLPRLLLTFFKPTGVARHQSLARDHLTYCDLATDRLQSANDIVRKHHAFINSRVNRRNSALADALRPAEILRRWLGVDVQLSFYHPPRCEG